VLQDFLRGQHELAGELLLGIARRAAAGGVDPEEALRRSANELMAHFVRTESAASAAGSSLSDAPVAQRQMFWQQASAPQN
jgi:uncharacterized protein YabN with tetrapyrrole methylase and pyrophosphatase domain